MNYNEEFETLRDKVMYSLSNDYINLNENVEFNFEFILDSSYNFILVEYIKLEELNDNTFNVVTFNFIREIDKLIKDNPDKIDSVRYIDLDYYYDLESQEVRYYLKLKI